MTQAEIDEAYVYKLFDSKEKMILEMFKSIKTFTSNILTTNKDNILELRELNKKYDKILENQEKILRVFEVHQIVECHKY